MADQRPSSAPPKEKSAPVKDPTHDKAGRSGEGSRSVIPHLRADIKARAVAKVGKRPGRFD